jgi:CubicO group peptidase (beta-lactamase class C family)
VSPPLLERVAALEDGGRGRLAALLASAVPEVAPAIVVAVRHRGELVVEVACGWPDPEDQRVPADPDLRFDLASVTKLVTATAVLGLVSGGSVGLDDPLVRVLPEFGSPSPRPVDGGQEPLTRAMLPTPRERRWWLVDPAGVSVRQLLTHTSGLAPWRSLFQVAGPMPPSPPADDPVDRADRRDAALAAIRTYPFVDRPGAAIRYSDLGFILLGMAAARLSGDPLEAVIEDRVARPLGLGTLTYRPLDAGVPRAAVAPTSFDALWRGRRSHGEAEDENAAGLGGVAGHAGLFAAAADVAAFGEAWLAADARLGLSMAVRDEALRVGAEDTTDRRGLGWQLAPRPTVEAAARPSELAHPSEPARPSELAHPSEPARPTEPSFLAPLGPRAFGHTGFTGTSLAVDPDRSLVVACLTNRVWAGRANGRIVPFRVALHQLLAEAFPAA